MAAKKPVSKKAVKDTSVRIERVVVRVAGKELHLTVDQARELHLELGKLLGGATYISYPVAPSVASPEDYKVTWLGNSPDFYVGGPRSDDSSTWVGTTSGYLSVEE